MATKSDYSVVIIILLFFGAIIAYAVLNTSQESNKKSAPPTTAQNLSLESSPENVNNKQINVSFKASDGYLISGTFWASISEKAPAIILVHQFGSTRHDFDSFVPVLLDNGYNVLAYDIRGFGQSKNGTVESLDDFPKDVVGAINYLKSQSNVDINKIGIIGASVGANVAYVASGSIPQIKVAVSLSPSNTGSSGVLLGHNIQDFSAHNILIASDENEKQDAEFIYNNSKMPKLQKTYPGFGHGVGILNSTDAQKDILDFLKDNL